MALTENSFGKCYQEENVFVLTRCPSVTFDNARNPFLWKQSSVVVVVVVVIVVAVDVVVYLNEATRIGARLKFPFDSELAKQLFDEHQLVACEQIIQIT